MAFINELRELSGKSAPDIDISMWIRTIYDTMSFVASHRRDAGAMILRSPCNTWLRTKEWQRIELSHVGTVGQFRRLCKTFGLPSDGSFRTH
jgi:hypothetical protein